jgi:hypothetical protein
VNLRFACLNLFLGIEFASPLPSADVISQMLRDRHSFPAHVVEILHFPSDFCADAESPGTRAAVIKFENASACAAGLFLRKFLSLPLCNASIVVVAPPCADVLSSLSLDVSGAQT